MEMKWLGVGLTAALGWALGCGGNVVIDEGSGGATTTGTTGTTSTTGTTTTTTGTVDPGGTCQKFCLVLAQLGCDTGSQDECVASCLSLYDQQPACAPQLTGSLECLLGNMSSCELPPVCIDAQNAYEQCTSASGCQDVACSGASDGSCECKGFCAGQDLAVECAPGPSGELACQCFAGGGFAGSCVENGGAACSFDGGCCAQFFFDFGG